VKSANGEDIAKVSEGYHHEAGRVRSIQITYAACKDWLEQHNREYFMPGDPHVEKLIDSLDADE